MVSMPLRELGALKIAFPFFNASKCGIVEVVLAISNGVVHAVRLAYSTCIFAVSGDHIVPYCNWDTLHVGFKGC